MTLPVSQLCSRRTIVRGLAGAAAGSFIPGICYGDAERAVVRSGGAEIEVDIAAQNFDLPSEAILDWVARCAGAVSSWLGGFPLQNARVRIVPADVDRGVRHGTSWGDRGAECRVSLGTHTTKGDLDKDWVLTHELFHFVFPSVPERHLWIEEGISTYAEPIARTAAGLLTPEQVWNDMIRDMPQGLPREGDRGLDETHTWGRTYWGGALFCLLADIGIHRATASRKGLRDALRGINVAGGNITTEWPLTRALETADHATGTSVMLDLYRQMAQSAVPVDLAALWEALGVSRNGDRVSFDNEAPLAQIRAELVK